MLLTKGNKSFEVVELQARLRKLGLYKSVVDGWFGNGTDKAVKEFQESVGLYVDGVVGNKTTLHLNMETEDALLFLAIHCSATREQLDVTGKQVIRYHTKGKGWSRVGYSDFIRLSGKVENLREYDNNDKVEKDEFTWGTRILNKCSRHICYAGGLDKEGRASDTRTNEQKKAMKEYVLALLELHPHIVVYGHNQVQRKACPSFSVPFWLRSIGVKKENIAKWNRYVAPK